MLSIQPNQKVEGYFYWLIAQCANLISKPGEEFESVGLAFYSIKANTEYVYYLHISISHTPY